MLGFSTRAQKRLAYGFWRYREQDVEPALRMLALARESGVDHFDTADIYGDTFGGAERLLGALRVRAPGLFESASLATKAGITRGAPYNSSPGYLAAACEASLTRLGAERIDLFYIHRPDILTHPADLADTLNRLHRDGKIAAVGVSNFTAAQIEALARWLDPPIAAHQIELSAAHVAPILDGALDQAMRLEIPVAAWSPLAGGRLGDADSADPAVLRVRSVLADLAQTYRASPEAVALAFLLHHPAAITPILGTRTPARFKDAMSALAIALTRADWYKILEARLGARMP